MTAKEMEKLAGEMGDAVRDVLPPGVDYVLILQARNPPADRPDGTEAYHVGVAGNCPQARAATAMESIIDGLRRQRAASTTVTLS